MALAEPDSTASAEQLRRVQAVTDAALAHMTLEGLLDELLSRTRELLDGDTAVVLLVDEANNELVATAAKGIEEEVERGVRVPLGRGFAGRVAATAKPVILDRVGPETVHNPLLFRRGIQTLLGVPLIVHGDVIGVLHVGSLKKREFTEEDVALLQLVADRIALAVRARVEEGRRMISTTLQRSLLPDVLPTFGDIEAAGRYVPAAGGMVGGDWYDVFLAPGGALYVVIGDVVGRGLEAAVAMSRLRNATRALAIVVPDPGPLMSRVADVLLQYDPGIMATMLIAAIDEKGGMRWANAGHLPPLLVDVDRRPTFIEEESEPPVGTWPHAYRTRQLTLPPASSLLLYTDGLVERRGVPLDDGLSALSRTVAESDWRNLEELCDGVLAAHGGARANLEDDLAVLVVRRREESSGEWFHVEIAADPSALGPLRRQLRRWLATTGGDGHELHDVLVATGEAVANAVEHAYGPGHGTVSVDARFHDGTVTVTVRDHGRWRPARGSQRGRGMSLMAGLTDEMKFDADETGTTVTLRKTITRRNNSAD